MLVLTRKINETITLGHPASVEPPIEVTIIEVRGDHGVSAPRSMPVHRKEVWLTIQQEADATNHLDK